MSEDRPAPSRRRRAVLPAAGLLAAGAAAGAVIASTSSASAAGTTATPSASPSSPSTKEGPGPHGPGGPGGPDHQRPDEKLLTGAAKTKATAAALEAVPGGTVVRAETDADGAAYEVHMTKADGTHVTVKLDKNFAVTKIETGMGRGGPHPGGKPDHPRPPAGARPPANGERPAPPANGERPAPPANGERPTPAG